MIFKLRLLLFPGTLRSESESFQIMEGNATITDNIARRVQN